MRKVILAAFVLVASACFGAPRYQAPSAPVPVSFAGVTTVSGGEVVQTSAPRALPRDTAPRVRGSVTVVDAGAPASFLRELDDSTLNLLLSEARRSSNDVRSAEARLLGARASRRLASLDLVPTITAVGSTTRQQQSIAALPGLARQLPQQQYWDVGFDASWEIDIYGRIARNVRAQQAFVASAAYGLEDVSLSVQAEVARSYFELIGAQQQLAVAQRNAENQRRVVKLTEERLAAGRGTAFDTERAKAALYLTLAATPALEAQIAVGRERIAILLGKTSDSLPPALSAAPRLPELPDTLYVGSPQQLIRRRPDVQAAERQLAAETMLVGAARAEYLPRLTLGARAGYLATSFDSLSRTGTSRLLIGPVLTFPLLDLARVNQRAEVAHARMDEARAEHNAAVSRALNESEASLVSYDRAHARLAILADAQASSARAADLAQQRFEAGLTDLLQVLDAQRTLLEAENQLVLGHTAAATALVAVYKAVGGTWPVR